MSFFEKIGAVVAHTNTRLGALAAGAFAVIGCSLGAGAIAARASNLIAQGQDIGAFTKAMTNILVLNSPSVNGASMSINPAALETGLFIGVASLGIVAASKLLSMKRQHDASMETSSYSL